MDETKQKFKAWHSGRETPALQEPCAVYYEYRYGMYRGTGYARAVYGESGWNLPEGWKVLSWEYLALADFSHLRPKPKKQKSDRHRKHSGGAWFANGKPPVG